MKVGRRLAVKLLNASKFALADLPESDPAHSELSHPLDRALIARLAVVVKDATQSFEDYDYARALERTETFFWWFCDYYLELVKGRRYGVGVAGTSGEGSVQAGATAAGDGAGSVARALRLSLSSFQRLLAPFLPFVTEEVWSWWQQGSVHRAAWPEASELVAAVGDGGGGSGDVDGGGDGGDGRGDGGASAREAVALDVTADVLREVRKAKSQAQVKMRAPVRRVLVRDTLARLEALELGAEDLREAGSIETLERAEAEEFAVEVELAEDPAGV
jgi:valyl-tRNA synthetase